MEREQTARQGDSLDDSGERRGRNIPSHCSCAVRILGLNPDPDPDLILLGFHSPAMLVSITPSQLESHKPLAVSYAPFSIQELDRPW
jgi:hypothetical protein